MSFIATYQAKKNLIAQKLNEKGVEASGSEGLSSLVDKINDIGETVGEYSKTVTLTWSDSGYENGRPESVQVFLIRNNEKVGVAELSSSNQWRYTFTELPYNTGYTVQGGYTEGYTVTNSNLNTTYTLNTGHLRLNVSVSGAPEGSDISSLSVIVDGPDISMRRTLTYNQIVSGQYDLGQVIPGAYIAYTNNADALVEGYNIDSTSCVADAVYLNSGATSSLSISIVYSEPEEVEPNENPRANVGQLSFEVLGPDSSMPATVTYANFTNGCYDFDDLTPGSYAVVQRNPMNLIDGYYLTSNSVICMYLTVPDNGTATSRLSSWYAPLLSAEPENEDIDIPVTITWNDNNNADLNRPSSVTVNLYADGVLIDSHACTNANNWSHTFNYPRYMEDGIHEINYSINVDHTSLYTTSISGFNITQTYTPETISKTVRIVWSDSNNAQNLRPSDVYCTLSNGTNTIAQILLNEGNGWTATMNSLPTMYNGSTVTYSFSFQSVMGYGLDVAINGNITTGTYTTVEVPRPPKTPK